MYTRLRSPIIELISGKIFPNELQASQSINISRYYIRESLKNKIIVKNNLKEKCAFFPYYFGMNNAEILRGYFG